MTYIGYAPYISCVIRKTLYFFVVVWLFFPSLTRANPEEWLSKAEQAYEQLEYEEALKYLIKIHTDKEASPLHKARAYLYMGVCFTALGDAQNAVAAFVEVLKLRPNFRIPAGVSPSIRAMFNAALKYMKLPETPAGEDASANEQAASQQNQEPVEIKASSAKKAIAGNPIEIDISVKDPGKRIASFSINWRRRKGPDFSTIQMKHKKGTEKVKASIPGITIGNDKGILTYYVEAKDADGQTIAMSGADDEPIEVSLEEKKKPKSKWGLYTLAISSGVAAIAGGIIAGVLLSRGGEQPKPGEVDVTIVLQ